MTGYRYIQKLEEVLSEGLDLCVRARQLDQAINEVAAAEAFPASAEAYPEHWKPCITPHLWVQEQYDTDLKEWEAKARDLLTKKAEA